MMQPPEKRQGRDLSGQWKPIFCYKGFVEKAAVSRLEGFKIVRGRVTIPPTPLYPPNPPRPPATPLRPPLSPTDSPELTAEWSPT